MDNLLYFLRKLIHIFEGDLSILLHSIEIASKYVSSKVRAAGLLDLYGEQGETNVQVISISTARAHNFHTVDIASHLKGEAVKKLDVIANDAFITSLKRSHKVAIMASEENELPIVVEGSKGNLQS